MRTKNISLAIHNPLPFEVTYHKDSDISLCTVRQDDLEGLYRSYRSAIRFGMIIGVCSVISIASLGYMLLNTPPDTTVVISQPLE